MSSPSLSKRNLRKNSSTIPNQSPNQSSFTLLDIQKLISESEERIKKHVNEKFEILTEKISSLEASVTEIKAVQVAQEADIVSIKKLIVDQQCHIEAFEERDRQCNLIISNLEEDEIVCDGDEFAEDENKVLKLFNKILPPDAKITPHDIDDTLRLGRRGRKPRTLKVRLTSVHCRNKILRSCKHLNLDSVRQTFGRVFVNKDMSFLRRLEEKRLREQYKQLRDKHPDGFVRLRNGKLYLGQFVKDCVDYRNQLF